MVNKMETFISDIRSDLDNPVFLPITNSDSVQLVRHTLNENNNDYLEGGISFIYDSEAILVKEMVTTDLLITWQSLIEPILFPQKKKYCVELLDSLYEIQIEEIGEGYTFSIKETYNDSEWISKEIPIKEYNKLVGVGFSEFREYLIKHQFTFSEESVYLSFMEDYEKIKNRL